MCVNSFRLFNFPFTFIILSTVLLNSCVVGPDYTAPKIDSPSQWNSDTPISEAIAIKDEQNWWESFNDPILNQLILKAINGNLDIQIAETRIAAARATQAGAMAALMPTGDLMFSANRQANQIGLPGSISGFSNIVKRPFNIFKTGFDASWELDLFGGHHRETESAQAELEASYYLQQDILISSLAEIANTYTQIRENLALLAIAEDDLATYSKTAEIYRQKKDIGEIAGQDLYQVQAQEQQAAAELNRLKNLITQAEYSLDILIGEQAGTTHLLINSSASPLKVNDKKLILDAPAAVIAQRPDIRNAERKLASATAQQGVAVAKFFPDISLVGFIGLFNTNASNFINVSSKSWSMGGNIFWPILSYGSLSANLEAANAKQQEAMKTYQKTILNALADVERSYTAWHEQEKYLNAIEKATLQVEQVYKISDQRYQVGLTSLLEVLEAKHNLNTVHNKLFSAQALSTQNLIAVYKSLGGSWDIKRNNEANN